MTGSFFIHISLLIITITKLQEKISTNHFDINSYIETGLIVSERNIPKSHHHIIREGHPKVAKHPYDAVTTMYSLQIDPT